jgi:8-oxo-dGTP diphosphatase
MRRLYPEQPLAGVGAILVCSGRILLEKRKNEPGKGKWSCPGGMIELGETAEQTIAREVLEETGLIVEKPELIDVVNNVELDERGKVRYHFVIIDYFMKLKGGRAVAASDAEELRWVGLDEVEGYALTGTFREFFQRNHEKLEKVDSCERQAGWKK